MRPATLIKRTVTALVLPLALLYIGDTMAFYIHSRHPTPTEPAETFTVPRILAIDEKGGKIEYAVDQVQREQTITCAHSIFPHAGFRPCWYAKNKASQPIPASLFLPRSGKSRFSVRLGFSWGVFPRVCTSSLYLPLLSVRLRQFFALLKLPLNVGP